MSLGNFAFGGEQRSFSFGCFHADKLPNSLIAVVMPHVHSQMVMIQNDPSSTGNAVVGCIRAGVVGQGIILEPGDVTGWIPVTRLDSLWHKELDATTFLNYMLFGCATGDFVLQFNYLLQETGDHVLLEDGGMIVI